MKRIIQKALAVILCLTCIVQFSGQTLAASFFGKTYVKDIILGYGNTPEEAKKWLTDNGYEIVDNNLNEGADSTFSTKRAVYLGYTTTKDPDEAITDMKLMNMNGNYSVIDYQLLLKDQRENIRAFIDNFIVAVEEYRENYRKGQSRAVAAHDLLNLLYDDDTETKMGDLLLERIREEYSEEEFAALSASEKAKHADMTTILMQSNATSVLVIEQTISLATDSGSSVWVERYNGVSSYDAMLEELMAVEGMSVSQAESELDAKYGEAAKAIAAKIPDYLDALKPYTESGIDLASSETDIVNYFKDKDASAQVAWYTAAAQYVLLSNALDSDGLSFIETITDETCDLAGEDNYMLYPFVSVLTEGQIACLDFLTLYQLVSLGINDDQAIGDAMKKIELDTGSELTISIYSGIDRAIFSENVAMTTDANSLQQSTGKDMTTNWFRDGISPSTVVIYISLGVSLAATIGCFVTSSVLATLAKSHTVVVENASTDALTSINALTKELYSHPEDLSLLQKFEELEENSVVENLGYVTNRSKEMGGYTRWSNVFKYVGIAMACVTVILLGVSLWRTIADLKAFYNAEYTPVPMYIVHQGVNENDEKVYTYYKAAGCNRYEANMVDDRTRVLESFGDLNGDVGRQWVAIYTTTDKAAGQPITADFVVQYANANIPGNRTALSLFGEKSAQNLTNKKNGFTYSDDKNGIYMFYDTDSGVFAGSAIAAGYYAIIAGVCTVALAAICILISKKSKKRTAAQ